MQDSRLKVNILSELLKKKKKRNHKGTINGTELKKVK